MSYPTNYFALGSASLSSLGFTDFAGVGSISAVEAYVGTHSCTAASTTPGDVYTTLADVLSGNVTVTVYTYHAADGSNATLRARVQPYGTDATTYAACAYGDGGVLLAQEVSGTQTILNSGYATGGTNLTAKWLALELRLNGTTITGRLLRTDNNQWLANTGSSGGAWTTSTTPTTGNNQVSTGTITAGPTSGSGSAGFRLVSSAAAIYFGAMVIDPATPLIDITSFSLSSASTTQQLTAGGFSHPLYGGGGGLQVTWSSSNTAVATVSNTGLVTFAGLGTATITATGIVDTSQTASSAMTGVLAPATTYTLTGPPSGGIGVPASFIVTPNGTVSGNIVLTPSGTASTGLGPWTGSYGGTDGPQFATWWPTVAGTLTVTPTNTASLVNPGALNATIQPTYAKPYRTTVSGFVTGLTGTLGCTILAGGVTYQGRTVAGIVELPSGSGEYNLLLSLLFPGEYVAMWDNGGGIFAPENVNVITIP